jgi:hypothetical protein
MLEDLTQAERGIFLIECFACDQKVFLRPIAVCIRQFNSLALCRNVYPVGQLLFNLLRGSWSSLKSVIFVSKLTAASCVSWTKEFLESDQSVVGCLVILN